MRKLIQSSLIIATALITTSGIAYAMQPSNEPVHNEKSIVASIEAPKTSDTVQAEQEPVIVPEAAPAASTTVVPEPTVAPAVVDNETTTWNFFIVQGFSRNQTAGIMGNLQQEHGFNTSDAAGGLGIAQWTQGRRNSLMTYARSVGDLSFDANQAPVVGINTQLTYLMNELKGGYVSTYQAIRGTDSVESVVNIFQNQFERCNPAYCMESQRVQYAYAILSKH